MTLPSFTSKVRVQGGAKVWCAVGGLILLQLWPFERTFPGTELCFLLTLLLGASAIRFAHRQGLVEDPDRWFLLFFAKVLLSALLLGVFWHLPLDPLGLLRAPVQDGSTTDANFYDFIGAYIAQSSDSSALNATWLSFGVIGWITAIYMVFGVATLNVALLNAVPVLIGILALAGTLRRNGGIPGRLSDRIAWAMFLPYGAYYEMSPGKEPLANCLLFVGVYTAMNLAGDRRRYALLFACFVLCAAVRANLAMVLGLVFLVSIYRSYGLKHVAVGIALLGGLFLGTISIVMDPSQFFDLVFSSDAKTAREDRAMDDFNSGADSPLKAAVGGALQSQGPVDLVLLSPVRAAVWYLLPYPLILPDFDLWLDLDDVIARDPYRFFKGGEIFSRLLSTWTILFTLPYLLNLLRWRLVRGNPFLIFAGGTFLLLLFLISNFQFINGGRYRVTIEPIGIALSIYSAWRLGDPTKLRRRVTVPLVVGAVLVGIMVLLR